MSAPDYFTKGASLRINEGDFTVCSGCGRILRFDAELRFSVATPAQLVERAKVNLREVLGLQSLQQAVLRHLKANPPPAHEQEPRV